MNGVICENEWKQFITLWCHVTENKQNDKQTKKHIHTHADTHTCTYTNLKWTQYIKNVFSQDVSLRFKVLNVIIIKITSMSWTVPQLES